MCTVDTPANSEFNRVLQKDMAVIYRFANTPFQKTWISYLLITLKEFVRFKIKVDHPVVNQCTGLLTKDETSETIVRNLHCLFHLYQYSLKL